MYRCRLCRGPVSAPFLDLGFMPPADRFLRPEQLHAPQAYYPLQMVRCNGCGFVQLNYVVDPSILYQEDYPYESSITRTGREHFRGFAKTVAADFGLTADDLVIDVGSNVGVLLDGFRQEGCRVLGVEPAHNIAAIAEHNGIATVSDFFSQRVAEMIVETYGSAKVITGSNVFAHIDDLDGFVAAAKTLLTLDGIIVIEAPYFANLVDKLEYDTVYHEHLSYLSVDPLAAFFSRHDMDLFRVDESDIHGGSIRIFVCAKGAYATDPSVARYTATERERRLTELDTLKAFAQRVEQHRDELMWLLRSLRREGHRIAGVSAPAKGMTLLNYCRIGPETLEFLTEKSALKKGRYAPGSYIKVVGDERLIAEDIDYALILAWNFKDEIMENLKDFREKGGKFIIPVPTPTIV
jgi:hypothetical protein